AETVPGRRRRGGGRAGPHRRRRPGRGGAAPGHHLRRLPRRPRRVPGPARAAHLWGPAGGGPAGRGPGGRPRGGAAWRPPSRSAAAVAATLADEPGVAHVRYPGRPDHPDAGAVADAVMPGARGAMVGLVLDGGDERALGVRRGAGGGGRGTTPGGGGGPAR